MKKVVITQYGTEEILHERHFVLELPDDVDAETLDDTRLEELADEAGVQWILEESTGIYSDRHDVESHLDRIWSGNSPPVVLWRQQGDSPPSENEA